MARPTSPASDAADRKQVELLRAAGTARRAALALSLSSTVIALARQAIRNRSPSLSDEEVLLRWAEIHYGLDLANRVRAHLHRRRR